MSETLVLFVAGVIIALVAWAISLLLTLNDKVTKIDQWRVGHEDAHDIETRINSERHNTNASLLTEIRRELHEMAGRKLWWKKNDIQNEGD